MNDYLMIATVVRPQGIHGECKIRSYAADIGMFRKWHTLFRKAGDDYLPVSVFTVRIQDGFVYARLDDSTSANEAEKYRGTDLYVDRANAAPAKGDAVLIADLIGCGAWDEDGIFIGTLSDVLQCSSVDTWVFITESGILMAPALRSVFPEVDTEQRRIQVIRNRLEEVAVRS